MNTIARFFAPALALLLAAGSRPQEGDPAPRRDVRLKEVARDGAKARFTAEGDFPDETIISVNVTGEPEFMMHAREVRITPQPAKEAVLERQSAFKNKKFSVQFAAPQGGFFRVSIVFNRSAQVYPEIVQALKDLRDTSWSESCLVPDPDALPEELESHFPQVAEWVDRVQRMQEKIEKAMADPAKWKAQAQKMLEEVPPLAVEASKFLATTPYHACMETLVQALNKMSNFDPGVPKPNFAPGSAEEAMAQSMSEDIPGELSDEFLKKQVRAYIARVRTAMLRERLIVPNRILLDRWNTLLARIAHARATDPELEAAQKAFEDAIQGVIRNIGYIRRDKKLLKQIDEKALDALAEFGQAMTEAAAERRRARGDAERASAADARVREVRESFTLRDRELRLIPK